MSTEKKKGNVGILAGDGPAPRLNGVVAAVTLGTRKKDLTIYGIFDGYKWLAQGEKANIYHHMKELHISHISLIHFDGGFYLRT